jgi:hypothetical protein
MNNRIWSNSFTASSIPYPRASSLVAPHSYHQPSNNIIHDTIVDRRANHAVVLITIVVLVVFEHKKNCDCVVVEVEFCGEITRQSPVLVFYIPGGCCKASVVVEVVGLLKISSFFDFSKLVQGTMWSVRLRFSFPPKFSIGGFC